VASRTTRTRPGSAGIESSRVSLNEALTRTPEDRDDGRGAAILRAFRSGCQRTVSPPPPPCAPPGRHIDSDPTVS
jgi:hypothetical protein